jgi:hypothetical protein
VVRQDVPELVGEDDALLAGAELVQQRGADDDHRLAGADGHGIEVESRGDVEVVVLGHVEDVPDPLVGGP